MKKGNRDYTRLTEIAAHCGLEQFIDRGNIEEGFYTMKGLHAPVDLTACVEDEKSILRTALKQLSEKESERWNEMIGRQMLGDY